VAGQFAMNMLISLTNLPMQKAILALALQVMKKGLMCLNAENASLNGKVGSKEKE
jgi:hypothetical protein